MSHESLSERFHFAALVVDIRAGASERCDAHSRDVGDAARLEHRFRLAVGITSVGRCAARAGSIRNAHGPGRVVAAAYPPRMATATLLQERSHLDVVCIQSAAYG